MLQLPSKLQVIRPVVPIQQIHYRNQFFKNWGKLNPLFFQQGLPRIVLPSYKSIGQIIIYFTFLLYLNFEYSKNYVFFLIRQTLFFAALYMYIFACQTDHGSAASGLPLLNQQTFAQYRGFCQRCLIFVDDVGMKIQQKLRSNKQMQKKQLDELQRINHCKKCETCFSGRYYHSIVLGICITSKNYWRFCGFYSTNFLLLISMCIIPIIQHN